MKTTTVTIQSPAQVIDDERGVRQSWSDVGSCSGYLIPINQALAFERFGINIETRLEFVTKRPHTALIAGNRILYGEKPYPIVSALSYGKAVDCLLDTSGES